MSNRQGGKKIAQKAQRSDCETSLIRAGGNPTERNPTGAPPDSWAPIALLLAAIAATTTLHLRLLQMPLERDEGEYALAGQLILDGYAPYQRLYNMKWPGTYYCYAAIEAAFGQSVSGIHVGVLLVNVAAVVLIFLVGRRLYDSTAASAAAVAYAVLSFSPTTLGFAGHATHFVVLAALLSVFCLQGAIHRQSLWRFFLAGAFAGLAPVMKQPGIVFTAFVPAYWIWHELRRADAGSMSRIKQGAALGAGILAPIVLMLASVWVTATEQTFWQWTVLYARFYGAPPAQAVLTELPQGFFGAWFQVARPALLLWIVSGLGLVTLVIFRRRRPAAAFLLTLLFFSLLGVLPGFVFRPHYFIVLLPVISLFIGEAVHDIRTHFAERSAAIALMSTPILLALPVGIALWQERAFYFWMSPNQVVTSEYPEAPFLESLPVADYIRDHTRQSDPIAVIGSEPEIYFYARRLPATGHAYVYAMMEDQPLAHAFQEQMINEIEEARPKYIVLVKVADSWLRRPSSDMTLLAWFQDYAARSLKIVGIVESGAGGEIRYRWNEPNMHANDRSRIIVFQNVPRPVAVTPHSHGTSPLT
jgi:4-amino-4-deoxy-L-arabinose transferase-like glycosyltransferase